MSNITAVIPFLSTGNREWLQQALDSLPDGLPYLVVENDGELAAAINHGFATATTEFVFLMGADDMIDGRTLEWLEDLAWDVDVTYPTLVLMDDQMDECLGAIGAQAFCPNRLQVWNYVPGGALVRRQAYLDAGGARELDMLEDWDAWVRMMRNSSRFKAVPEANYYYRQSAGSRNKLTEGDTIAAVRDRMLPQIIGDREPFKASWYYQATPATTYWRCLLPARYLPGQAVHLTAPYDENTDSFPQHEGAAIFQFAGDGGGYIVSSTMQRLGIPVLVEVDDNYLVRQPNMARAGWKKTTQGGGHSIQGHAAHVRDADGVIVTTEYLARQYRKVTPSVFVCPNQIDPADWPELEEPDDGIVRVGWFASFSHRDDARLVHRALEWASRQRNVEVVTMGVGVSKGKNWWPDVQHKHVSWTNDMGSYRKMMYQVDIGLAPIVPTAWSECRSDLKALEYAMAGAAPVLSATAPYSGWRDGERCLKAQTPAEFLKAVQHLVRHPDEARQMAQEARAHVLSERTVAANIWRWQEAIDGATQRRAESPLGQARQDSRG